MNRKASAFKSLVLSLALSAFTASAQAPGDVRIALVIGNSAYKSAPALVNPSNDAKAMSEALRGLGFMVVEVRDASKAQMAEGLAQVQAALKGKQGIGMLYYAGHGLQMDARNFMVPVEANMSKAADIPAQTMEVGQVINAFKSAGNRMNVLVLDACRDNPFGGIATGKGLAPVDAPSGTFLAYATAPGNVAEDGDAKSGNGLYTQYLLQELKKPQASIENVFKRVRFAVRKASNGRQIPWESTSLEDDFQFNDGRIVAIAKPTTAQITAAFSIEKADWDRIKDSPNVDDFYAFVQKYPSGPVSEAAYARINFLQAARVKVQGADGKDQSYAADKFRLGDVFEVTVTVPGAPKPMKMIHKVTKVEPDRIEVLMSYLDTPGIPPTIQYFDGTGGLTAVGNVSRYNPPQHYVPGGLLQVGKRWTEAYEVAMTGQPVRTMTSEARVAAREPLTTPAGTFNAFRFDVSSRAVDARGEQPAAQVVVWMSPDVPMPLRTEATVPGGFAGGKVVTEMTKITRGN
jgi:hypothetical protein